MNSLFTPSSTIVNRSEEFSLIATHPGYLPAKNELLEIYLDHPNPDKNLIEQFQSKNGFSARTWELYLLAFLLNSGYGVNCDDDSPDFFVANNGTVVAMEAVTTNRGKNIKIFERDDKEYKDYLSIKFGSTLYSKLQKKYWEEPNISGLPIVLAIAPFHSQDCHYNTEVALINYLYGTEDFGYHDANKNLIIESRPIQFHQYKKKKIPSGFFKLPGSENISAVLYSNAGTIAKFNRMGYLKKPHLYPNISMTRLGTAYCHTPNASKPDIFSYTVGDNNFPETWGQEIHIFHNPNARHPLDKRFFEGLAQSWLRENSLISSIPPFYPKTSQTIIINQNNI